MYGRALWRVRLAGTVAAMALGLTLLGGVAGAAQPTVTAVTPTGDVATDVANVQAAIDQGGTVLLKSRDASGEPMAFNFGEPTLADGRSVDVTTDVEIVGERVGGAETTIHGGWNAISSSVGANLTVRGITFDRPLGSAVKAFDYSPTSCWGPYLGHGDLTVTDTVIRDVVGLDPPYYSEGIEACGHDILIADNVIDGVDAGYGEGISAFRSSGSIQVLRNEVTGTTVAAIEIGPTGGSVHIADNVLRPGPGIVDPGYPAFVTPAYGIEINGTGTYAVEGNDVLCESPSAIGIWALGFAAADDFYAFGPSTSPVISGNRVTMAPSRPEPDGYFYDDGIDLMGEVDGGFVGQNTVTGHGMTALGLWGLGSGELSGNTLVGNNIARYAPDFADVFLDAPSHGTVLKGLSGTVADLGTENLVSGFTKGGQSGSGQQVSAAVQLRRHASASAADRALHAPAARP